MTMDLIRDETVFPSALMHCIGFEEVLSLGADGTAENAYREPLVWSPQGTRLACLRVRPAPTRTIHLLESSPRDQLQPKLRTLDYAKPGDVIDQPHIALLDAVGKRTVAVEDFTLRSYTGGWAEYARAREQRECSTPAPAPRGYLH